MDAAFFRDWLTAAAAVVEAQRDHLTQLDAAIGDADHGINMARGFGAITAALAQKDPPTPGAVLTLAGSTLISKVGVSFCSSTAVTAPKPRAMLMPWSASPMAASSWVRWSRCVSTTAAAAVIQSRKNAASMGAPSR